MTPRHRATPPTRRKPTSPHLICSPSYVPGGPTTTGGLPNVSWSRGQREHPVPERGWWELRVPGRLLRVRERHDGIGRHGVPSTRGARAAPGAGLLPPRRSEQRRLADRVLRLPAQGCDEALMAATSTDDGKDWTYAGEASNRTRLLPVRPTSTMTGKVTPTWSPSAEAPSYTPWSERRETCRGGHDRPLDLAHGDEPAQRSSRF